MIPINKNQQVNGCAITVNGRKSPTNGVRPFTEPMQIDEWLTGANIGTTYHVVTTSYAS